MLKAVSVLVADDSPTARMFVSRILSDQFNCKNVIQAKTGDEAWGIVQSNASVDWVISDWEMPGLAGDELLYRIRRDPRNSEMPFIMMTSRSDKSSLITAAQAGVSDFIIKPFSADVLMEKIKRIYFACERRRKQRLKADGKTGVKITSQGGYTYSAYLGNISASGCLLKHAPDFSHKGCLGIYDTVDIDILSDFGHIQLKGSLVRMEQDFDSPNSNEFIQTAFEFLEMDADNKARLIKLLDNLKSRLPDVE